MKPSKKRLKQKGIGSKGKRRGLSAKRLSFPADEERLEWLPMLLDAYYTADRAIESAIRKRLRRGESLACAKGCSSCCHIHVTIPVYPLELVGIYWFCIEKLLGKERDRIRQQLEGFQTGSPCPFLLDGICAIHPMRPLACRHFNVFNRPCRPGEDPFYTRRQDVLTPDEAAKQRALELMLPFHGFRDRAKRKLALSSGYLNRQVQNLHEIDWKALAQRMTGRRRELT
jgi:Fe-S-cluster containining protein